ncbi:Biogenesis of lysosome-related organelles complex 1 subunit 1 [Fusarium keratoplasticum]|uniref:Biogenesis of lysosome-related organelles complex 1 subunit 1 n=1 Tax=Fusarium keratoplasticum TaxID=1328300 RepID=A0ACC0RG86_9HYPO|nr:Biogenesis of lysosome-related organelles complex 1 subunit 1 [Fusarium keratoplasticum]KAI8684610.1 Biogenesis of lysosome-related organelles complex 1 subunit 1 [Fusarium keratoplasticum]
MSASRSSQQAGSSSSAGGPSSSRPPTSPPPSIASPSIAHAHAHAQIPGPSSSSSAQRSPPPPHLQPTLPSPETQRHVTEARRAVVATLENMMDSELQWRASTLHSNAAALGKQAKDVRRAADGLRRENDRLAREADVAARRLKELGNVQNWAEVLERDFLVLEETVRLANGEGSCSCSCSECGSVGSDSEDEMDVDGPKKGVDDHGKTGIEGMAIDTGHGMPGTFSDASRSLTDPESSMGRGTKGSDTASMSTASR